VTNRFGFDILNPHTGVKNRPATLWLWLLLTSLAPARADSTADHRTTRTPQYQVTYWTSEHGLPQNTITCLLQTRDGYLWIGTRYGLARYDGVRVTGFVNELCHLSTDALDVRGLAQDTEGRLWLHSLKALVCYHQGRFSRLTLPDAPIAGRIQGICASREGGLWVAKPGGLVHFSARRIVRSLSLTNGLGGTAGPPTGEIERLFEDSRGRVWFLAASGTRKLWHCFDPRTGAVAPLTDPVGPAARDAGTLIEDRAGRWWMGVPGELLCWENGRLSRFAASNAWGPHEVYDLTEDTAGNIWAASKGPVQLHRFAAGQFTSYGRESGLINPDDIRSLRPDREGNLWVGTGSGGLHRFQPRKLVSLLAGSYSTEDEVYGVAPGQNGRVWLSTTYGLVQFQEGRFIVYTNTKTIGDGLKARLRPVFEDRTGQVWFGLDGNGLHTLRGGRMMAADGPDLSGPSKRWLNSIFEDRAGTLWVATQRGLLERRQGQFRLWTTEDGLSANQVFGLTEGPDGTLWVGTEHAGINRFKDGRFRAYSTNDGLLHQNAWPLRAEPDGSVWVGTPVGLNRIQGEEVRAVTMRQGLFDNLAYCLLEDRRGNYWTFGNRGIWRMKKADLGAAADGRASSVLCVAYGEAEGMASSEGNGDQYPNAAVLPNGELWFPTTCGVVILDPERLPDNLVRPSVVIEEVRVDEETVFKDGGFAEAGNVSRAPAGRAPPGDPQPGHESWPPLHLSAGRARVLEIRYTANTLIDSEKARFRFRLEGYDQGWREADTRRVAFYTNLRPGRYRFLVMACNHHGIWSKEPARFEFSLAPRFYQTWSFRGLCGLAGLAALWGWQSRRHEAWQRIQNLAQQQALHEERSRIAKDLHDELGANLTGVALQVEVARRRLDRPAVLEEDLQNVAQSIRSLVDRMREVVWAVNPQCDTLESFCTYLAQYAENFLATAGLRCRLDLPEQVPAETLSAETRHHLILVIKEALNNAAKHACASEVRLGLSCGAERLVLTIEDNGRGFPTPTLPDPDDQRGRLSTGKGAGPAESGSGRGLGNMQRRIQSLGGQLELASRPGAGARITLQVPLARKA
jgi:signal transduction histidine kinase/ligand-binding sensor domain-containing protein